MKKKQVKTEAAMTAKRIGQEDVAFIAGIAKIISSNSGERPSPNQLQSLFADDRTYLLAAILEVTVIGYTLAYRFPSLYTTGSLAYLYDIEVLPEYRRKGAGKLLIQLLRDVLKADAVTELWLGTAIDNEPGQAFFLSTGAEKSGETFNDYTYYLR